MIMLETGAMQKRLFSLFLPLLLMPQIRVALFKEVPKATVQGYELWVKTPELRPIGYHIDDPAHVSATDDGFRINSENFDYPFIQIGAQKELIDINGKKVGGLIEIRKTPNGKLLILNELPLEDYLVGLIHGEISANWHPEVLKAQAVAARTYALKRQQKKSAENSSDYDLESDIADQVYAGMMDDPKDQLVKEIVAATKGEVLWMNGLYPTYFHSCCGGQTELANRVWGKKESSYSVIDPFCERSPQRKWQLRLSQRDFLNRLKNHGLEGSRIKNISLERYEDGPRNVMMIIETDKTTLFMGATDLRRILGYKELRSTWFDVDWSPHEIVFTGTGYGHGVGFCQWGAKAMAESGKTYQEILKFYYPKATIRKMY